MACTTIGIKDDNIIEGSANFTVKMIQSDQIILGRFPETKVTIVDDGTV